MPRYLLLATLVFTVSTLHAESSTRDAALGGGLGGAAGAAAGNEVGGREGAIVGGAIGGALGAAIGTEDNHDRHYEHERPPRIEDENAPEDGHPQRYHCPPGQRKKGRC